MKTKLYAFQERGVEFHLRHRYSLNLCEMGLGKTIQALAVAEKVGGRVVILCPAFLQENWRAEIRKHVEGPLDCEIIPYSRLSTDTFNVKKCKILIADEIHYLKNPDANRTKAALDIVKSLKPDYFIGLTGTPIKNRVPEFYTLLSLVSMNPRPTSGIDLNKYFRNKDHFAARYCYLEQFSVGSIKVKKWHGFNMDRLEEFKELLQGKVFKVKSEDALELPPMIHKRVQTNIEPISTLEKEFEAFLAGGKNIMAKKSSATLKAKATAEYVQDILDQGDGPVVVFTDHVDSAKLISRHFKLMPITGETPIHERSVLTDKFNGGDIPVLIATIGSFSVGVNLTAARHLVFNDISWVPGDNFQAMKRIHRIGQTKPCVIHYMLAGHVDEYILDTLQQKMAVIDTTNSLALGVSA